ncbi:MAG: YbjN domain-containing protein [Planctomycetes bacterium]|nr:YbjN domain-containing protein [Planctomycetota bacterium]
MVHTIRLVLAALALFIFIGPRAAAQDDKVFRAVTPAAVEATLKDLKIEFKKATSKKGDEHYFDFQRETYRIRLTHFSPQELMLDCVFRGLPVEKVNQWNTVTKLARASWHKDSTGEFSILEYGLDISGGATAGTIKQFITRFEDELKKYDKFLGANLTQDVILAQVTNDALENIFKTQGINYKKKLNTAGVMMFDFAVNKHSLRLYNFGGKDLMLDAHFKKISLDEANRYNLNRKFIRVVNYRGKDVEYTALECNLDCEAGATEGMIRHWILSFGEDARHFSEYTQKLQTAGKQ